MKKTEMIARAKALSLGKSEDIEKMSEEALASLLKENDLEFKGADNKKSARASGDAKPDDDPRTGVKKLCRIEVGAETHEKGPVYGCVNGYDFHGPRGKEIHLDEGFIKHLQSQMITESEAVLDEKGRPTGEVIERDRPRFQVSVLD